MASSSQLKINSWRQVYFDEGPEAAQKFCCDQVLRVKEKINLISLFLTTVKQSFQSKMCLQALSSLYQEKMGRYSPDQGLGEGDIRVASSGRGEPGRSPFNYPDFSRRFLDPEELKGHLMKKILLHEKAILLIRHALAFSPDQVILKEWEAAHTARWRKWTDRYEQADLSVFLLPPMEEPPETRMGISWAHAQGYFGEGASALVFEKGCDLDHPALKEVFLSTQKTDGASEQEISHGTHVSGIIAARESGDPSLLHSGVAPRAQLHLLFHTTTLPAHGIDLVNYSQGLELPLTRFIQTEDWTQIELFNSLMILAQQFSYLMGDILPIIQAKPSETRSLLIGLQEKVARAHHQYRFKGLEQSLIVTAMGNDGVVFSDVPSLRDQDAYLLDRLDLTIGVVNLLPNCLYPCPSSRLPGAEFAQATLCAWGTDVLSTVPNNQYEKRSGTSMAAPHVTGVALLLKGAFPELTPAQIRECLLCGAKRIVLDANMTAHLITNPEDLAHYSEEQIQLSERYYGRGLVDAEGAFKCAEKMVVRPTSS